MEQSEIDALIATADKRAVYLNQVEHAKAKFRSLNVLYWEGHTFELSQEFMAYLFVRYMSWLTPKETTDSNKLMEDALLGKAGEPPEPVILLDKNDEPVSVANMTKFVEAVEECNTEALNYWFDTYTALKHAQTTSELIEVG